MMSDLAGSKLSEVGREDAAGLALILDPNAAKSAVQELWAWGVALGANHIEVVDGDALSLPFGTGL